MDIKKPTTFDEQINIIENRGCIIDDKTFAKDVLSRVNYYRLTAYFLPFKNVDGNYKAGTKFETIYQIHEFDRKLRHLLFPVIEEIELMLRTQLSYYHVHTYGALGYLNKDNFNAKHNHTRFKEHIEKSINNNKHQLFVSHHINNYGGSFPLWAVIELFTMGELSIFFSDMHTKDKKKISKLFHSSYANVSSWLLCLTNLRNYCAHYSRLYYSNLRSIPATPSGYKYTLGKTLFDYILMLKFLYIKKEQWITTIVTPLAALVEQYEEYINLRHIGFTDDWNELLSDT